MTKIKTCECGAVVRGSSLIHAEANLKLHKISKKHKELMILKKAQQKAPKRKSESSESTDDQDNSNPKLFDKRNNFNNSAGVEK